MRIFVVDSNLCSTGCCSLFPFFLSLVLSVFLSFFVLSSFVLGTELFSLFSVLFSFFGLFCACVLITFFRRYKYNGPPAFHDAMQFWNINFMFSGLSACLSSSSSSSSFRDIFLDSVFHFLMKKEIKNLNEGRPLAF